MFYLFTTKVTIDWDGPYLIDRLFDNDDELLYENGIYEIVSTELNRSLYIGKAKNTFYDRLDQHLEWLGHYPGIKKVRFGTIKKNADFIETHIQSIESVLIYETQPLHNIKSTFSYTIGRHYVIFNVGKKSRFLPFKVETRNHI